MTPSTPSATGPMTLRCTEDLLAAVPVTLGFVPHDSVVMLAAVGARCFQARVDLPAPGDTEGLAVVVDALVAPTTAHDVRRVALVLYTDDAAHGAHVTRALATALRRRRVEVFDAVRVHGDRWWPARGPRAGAPGDGTVVDVASHPFAADAVLAGRVVLASRADLAATLAPVPDVVRAVADEVARQESARDGEACDDDAEAAWVAGVVLAHRHRPGAPDHTTLARLLRALRVTAVRDAVWAALPPGEDGAAARADAAFWVEVVRRSPVALRVAPAAMLALAAWGSGQGALAWCAVDVSRESEPGYRLTELVAELLERAVPPGSWGAGGVGPGGR